MWKNIVDEMLFGSTRVSLLAQTLVSESLSKVTSCALINYTMAIKLCLVPLCVKVNSDVSELFWIEIKKIVSKILCLVILALHLSIGTICIELKNNFTVLEKVSK